MATIEMKTLTIGEQTFEIVDDKARKDIEQLSGQIEGLGGGTGGGTSGGSGVYVPTFLNGLKYYAFGDSIVDNQGTTASPETFGSIGYTFDLQGNDISGITVKGYVQAIEEKYGLVCSNFGASGHTLTQDMSSLVSKNFSDVALVTIAYGVNDARLGVPLGDVNSTDITTFAGCLNVLLRKIYTDNPECRVIVLTPIQRLYVSDFGIATPNANGNYLIDFVDMCKKVAQKRSTICIDMYRDSGINQTNLYYYTVEGVHPLNQCYLRMAMPILKALEEMTLLEFNPFGIMTNTGDTEPEEPDTGGDGGGEDNPPEEDTGATEVDISSMLTNDGYIMDGWGTAYKKDLYKHAVYHPESNKTYTMVTYAEASLIGESNADGKDRRMWSFTILNEDGSVKSGNYLHNYPPTFGNGSADSYESVTIDGVEYCKMTMTQVTGDVADNYYWNIPCLATLVDHAKVSYI